MYSVRLAECFPSEDCGVLYECCLPECFYFETLMKATELVWKHRYDHTFEDVVLDPYCPSCHNKMELWVHPDEQQKELV